MRMIELAGAMGLLALAACGDGGPAATGHVQVAMGATASSAATSGETPLLADTYTDLAGNVLVIDAVQVVVRKVKLEGNAGGCIDDDDEGEDTTSTPMTSDSTEEHEEDDDCGVIRMGPFLVDLPLNGTVEHQFTATVDTGTYTEAKFQIHKPEGSNDVAFLALHPEFDGVSVRVTGTYNGAPFTFTTGVTDVQEVEFDPPLVVTEGTVSFTVTVDLSGWFRGESGALVDPATAIGDGVNASLVAHNIIRSFHGFEDEDHDGHDDHDD